MFNHGVAVIYSLKSWPDAHGKRADPCFEGLSVGCKKATGRAQAKPPSERRLKCLPDDEGPVHAALVVNSTYTEEAK
jgi:hypothetical protein